MNGIALTAIKLAITIALLYFALRGIDLSATAAKVSRLDPAWTLAAVLACLGQLLVGAVRWRAIITACGGSVTTRETIRLLLIGTFFGQTLPSTVGGDGVRLFLLQRAGASWRTATYSVLIDRAIGLIVLSVMVVVSLPWSYQLLTDQQGKLALVIVDVIALAGCAAFLLFAFVPPAFAGRWFASRHLQACARTTIDLMIDRHAGAQVILASIASQLFAVAIAWAAARAVASSLTFDQAFLLVLPVTLVMLIPVSIAGWGVREQALQFAFLNAGMDGGDGVLISLLFGGAYFVVGIAGGLAWLLTSDRLELKAGMREQAGQLGERELARE